LWSWKRCHDPFFPTSRLALSSDDVQILYASLEQPATLVCQLAQVLSDDERGRAERFHFERDMRRFTVSHGLLRIILGRYLGVEPGRLCFHYGTHGKPYLSPRSVHLPLQFNLSHSHELVLYALTLDRQIGVDVEYVRPIQDMEQIAARFFSPPEYAALCSLPESQKLEAFFNCWTRKEAYIKAIGDGLVHPLDRFQVSLAPGEPARLLSVEGAPEEAERWVLRSLTPVHGYIAALAVEGSDWRLKCRRVLF
jgi:4'-phosphopantetheinyl transferase